jgi:hypothetical protein
MKNYREMAKLMRSQSRTGGLSHATMVRNDVANDW